MNVYYINDKLLFKGDNVDRMPKALKIYCLGNEHGTHPDAYVRLKETFILDVGM